MLQCLLRPLRHEWLSYHILEPLLLCGNRAIKNGICIQYSFPVLLSVREHPFPIVRTVLLTLEFSLSMSQNFYKKICGADLNIVLDNLKRIYEADKHLEITNLIINDYNDSAEEITKLANFIVDNLGCNVPLHFSRAFPYYKLNDIATTSEDKLFEAKKIANECGLEYVYIGNLECDTNTYCPNCGETLLKRNSYSTEVLNKNKKCMKCGKELNIRF